MSRGDSLAAGGCRWRFGKDNSPPAAPSSQGNEAELGNWEMAVGSAQERRFTPHLCCPHGKCPCVLGRDAQSGVIENYRAPGELCRHGCGEARGWLHVGTLGPLGIPAKSRRAHGATRIHRACKQDMEAHTYTPLTAKKGLRVPRGDSPLLGETLPAPRCRGTPLRPSPLHCPIWPSGHLGAPLPSTTHTMA